MPREEPLARELADFVSAARARTQPLVDGAAGRRALVLAQQVAARWKDDNPRPMWTAEC